MSDENEGHRAWRTRNASERRAAILGAIGTLTRDLGYPPLQLEIAAHVQMDVKTVRFYLRQLTEEGLVEEPGGRGTRTLRLTGKKPPD